MPEVLHTGRFLEMVRHQGWEYVRRRRASAVVGIVAVTPAGELLMVEQYRIPIAAPAIELPAGLVGDDDAGEDLLAAAGRELLEETGFQAGRLRILGRSPNSAGLTDEITTLVLAEDLVQRGPGGGVDSESILVHRIPLAQVPAWLDLQAPRALIDLKILAGLWWLGPGKSLGSGGLGIRPPPT